MKGDPEGGTDGNIRVSFVKVILKVAPVCGGLIIGYLVILIGIRAYRGTEQTFGAQEFGYLGGLLLVWFAFAFDAWRATRTTQNQDEDRSQ